MMNRTAWYVLLSSPHTESKARECTFSVAQWDFLSRVLHERVTQRNDRAYAHQTASRSTGLGGMAVLLRRTESV